MPSAHALIDCLILLLWLATARSIYQPKASQAPPAVQPVLFLQEEMGTVPFGVMTDLLPPPQISLIAAGCLPATAISDVLRPEGGHITLKKLWDPVWFMAQEVASALVWFIIGAGLDFGFLRIPKVMLAYIVVRVIFLLLLMVHRILDLGWRIEVLCWAAFGFYVLFCLLRWLPVKRRDNQPGPLR